MTLEGANQLLSFHIPKFHSMVGTSRCKDFSIWRKSNLPYHLPVRNPLAWFSRRIVGDIPNKDVTSIKWHLEFWWRMAFALISWHDFLRRARCPSSRDMSAVG